MRPRLDLPQPIVPIFWGLFFLEATYGAYLSVWPLWIERLGAPVAIVGFVLGIGGFLRLFVLAPSAWIAERFGYRRVIVIARLVAIAGFLGAAASNHWTQLLLVVLALAIGEMVFPLVQTLVAAESGDRRMRSFALVFNVGPSIALAISPLVGAGMVALLGMRSAFVLGALFSAISVLFFTRIEVSSSVAGRDSARSATYAEVTHNSAFRLVGLLLLLSVFSLSFGVAFIPTFLKDVRGYAASEITALGALPALGSAIFGLGVARIRRLQQSPLIAAAIPVGAMSLAFLILRETAALSLIMMAFLLRGGLFACWATLISALGELAPERLRSRSFAMLEMIGGMAFASGPMIAGILYGRRETLPFEIAFILALGMVPLFVLAQRRTDNMPKSDAPDSSDVGVVDADPGADQQVASEPVT